MNTDDSFSKGTCGSSGNSLPSALVNSNIIPPELVSIYINTFQDVGAHFLNSLMREITVQTQIQSALLLQLLTADDYKELTKIYKKNDKCKLHIISSSLSNSSSPEIQQSACISGSSDPSPQQQPSATAAVVPVDLRSDMLQDKFLLIRSSFLNEENSTSKTRFTNTVIPVSQLNPSSPYLKALLNTDKSIHIVNQHTNVENEEIERGIYPAYRHFVAINLDSSFKKNASVEGLLCLTTNNDISPVKVESMATILNAVNMRCVNELLALNYQEQLIIARDLAVLDAENKLKFLADMSHEIRTPMNAVIALTDLLLQERSSLNLEQIEHLEVIQTSGSHLLTIINDILNISKLNHDPKFKLENRRFSLRKCLKDTLNMARHQASMSQQNKVVYVIEYPPDKDDNIPLPELIANLEDKGILLRPLMQKKGKTVLPIIWKIDSDVPDHLLGDTMRLTQILLNLCSNAVKFTKEGGIHIRIKRSTPTPLRSSASSQTRQTDRCMTFKERYDAKIETIWNQAREKSNFYNPNVSPGSSGASSAGGLTTAASAEEAENADYFTEKAILEISVTDTGIGIPADRLPKLFKSFSQIDISTARRYGGTGLGLAISSTLVNRMGGCLWVESEEGVGSRFALTLPFTVAPRGRKYSSDTTPLGFAGSPSSPCSTVSDSNSSVNSAAGNNGNNNDLVSPISSSVYTFTTPALNSNLTSSGYFPTTGTTASNLSQSLPQQQSSPSPQYQQQSFSHRPTLSRTCHSQPHLPNGYNVRSDNSFTSQLLQNFKSGDLGSPTCSATDGDMHNAMASHAPSTPATYLSNIPEDGKRAPANSCHNAESSTKASFSSRKPYSDILSPASRSSRVGITKQYFNRKPQSKEENLAKIYPLRILLAEDNILNQKIAISILKRLGYVDVEIANNGREVLTLMKLSAFDVIFMDLYMPEMDGLEVTREIIRERTRGNSDSMDLSASSENLAADLNNAHSQQSDEKNNTNASTGSLGLLNASDVYIIALTASASREDRQICIDAGMDDFISKPFTMTEMKQALKTCANKRKKRRKLMQKHIEDGMKDEKTNNNNNNNNSGNGSSRIAMDTTTSMKDASSLADVTDSNSTPNTVDDPMLDVQTSPTELQ